MYTSAQLDAEILTILGMPPAGRILAGGQRLSAPTKSALCATPRWRVYFIDTGGVGGEGGAAPPGRKTLTQEVQHALRRLEDQGLVRHFYMDTRGLVFTVHGHKVIPSFPVIGVYQFAGPLPLPPAPVP